MALDVDYEAYLSGLEQSKETKLLLEELLNGYQI